MALVEGSDAPSDVVFGPRFGRRGGSNSVAIRCGLRSFAKMAIALFACGMGDCAPFHSHSAEHLLECVLWGAYCTNGTCNNRSLLSAFRDLFASFNLHSKRPRKHHGAPPTMGGNGPANPFDARESCLRLPVGLYGGRCVGGLRAQRSMVLFHPGLRPYIVRHPAHGVAMLSTAKEPDAMIESETFFLVRHC